MPGSDQKIPTSLTDPKVQWSVYDTKNRHIVKDLRAIPPETPAMNSNYALIEKNLMQVLEDLKCQPALADRFPDEGMSYEDQMSQISEWIKMQASLVWPTRR